MGKTKAINERKTKFGTEPVGKLLISLAVPAIIANLVNALYNVVDQIFIGQKIGFLGNAATNVAFPITTICLAIGLMTGVGAATNFNLELGRKRPKRAKSVAGTAATMLLLSGIILYILINIFLRPMLTAFGATDQIFDYAIEYTQITSLGIPFLLFSIGANPMVRADGNSFYSMLAIVIGAITNTILDPLFMFGFNMGMDGAAWATVIGQFISAIMLGLYFFRFKSVKFELKDFKIKIREIWILFMLGTSPLIFQCSALIVQIVTNNLLKIYGAKSIYGSEIPIAVAGIVMKINVIFIAILLGLTQGAQPIAGFNYGAKKYKRVREILKLTIKVAFIISLVSFAIFEIFPFSLTIRPYPNGFLTLQESTIQSSFPSSKASFSFFSVSSFKRGVSPQVISTSSPYSLILSFAIKIACPVPSCSSCVTKSTSPISASTSSFLCPKIKTFFLFPIFSRTVTTLLIIGTPFTLCKTLDCSDFILVPFPAAKITEIIISSLKLLTIKYLFLF